MKRLSSDDLDGQGYDDEERVRAVSFAAPTADSFTSQPERDLQPGDPNLTGGAPPDEKKTMAEKVKGLFKKGHHDDDDGDADSTDASPSAPHLQGVPGEQAGAALTDEHGNLKPGPHTDSVKRETIITKIKDKLHGSK